MPTRQEPSSSKSTSGGAELAESKKGGAAGEATEIEFTGNAKEYFGIWIVNLVLTLVTLGIYSAWAKVRTETYFKNNTKIFGTGFGYHATGGQILKGRLIIFSALVVFNLMVLFAPIFAAIAFVIPFLLPWVINSSARFSARMTSFRNIHFNWHGTYWQTMWFLFIAPLGGMLTLGLLTPLISKYKYSYIAYSYSYGTTRFNTNLRVRDFYLVFLITIFNAIVIFLIFLIFLISLDFILLEYIIILLDSIIPLESIIPDTGVIFMDLMWGIFISFFLLLIICWLVFFAFIFLLLRLLVWIYAVLCRNLMVKSMMLDTVLTFDSQINPRKVVWIFLSNLVLVLLSLGLLFPWAQIRMYRYLSAMTFVTVSGNIESFIDEINTNKSSVGEAYADFEGIEVFT